MQIQQRNKSSQLLRLPHLLGYCISDIWDLFALRVIHDVYEPALKAAAARAGGGRWAWSGDSSGGSCSFHRDGRREETCPGQTEAAGEDFCANPWKFCGFYFKGWIKGESFTSVSSWREKKKKKKKTRNEKTTSCSLTLGSSGLVWI